MHKRKLCPELFVKNSGQILSQAVTMLGYHVTGYVTLSRQWQIQTGARVAWAPPLQKT